MQTQPLQDSTVATWQLCVALLASVGAAVAGATLVVLWGAAVLVRATVVVVSSATVVVTAVVVLGATVLVLGAAVVVVGTSVVVVGASVVVNSGAGVSMLKRSSQAASQWSLQRLQQFFPLQWLCPQLAQVTPWEAPPFLH